MNIVKKSAIVATGLAMFSMFFGAGNVVFPLALGQIAQDQNFYAILGMLITAVGVPFIGLIAMTLFNGDYTQFFDRIGRLPGFLVVLLIMGLIGPFGAIPRCVVLSYSTVKMLLPDLSLPVFSAISCIIIWLFTIKKNSILDTLGYVLTPLLLGSLGLLIVKGLFSGTPAAQTEPNTLAIFLIGLVDGYKTMDLLGAFFFSSVIIDCLKSGTQSGSTGYKNLMVTTLKSIAIGAPLLALTYIGFSYVASFYSSELTGVSSDELIGKLAVHILGSHAAILACITVALACLTTAIALSVVFAEFLHLDVARNKINYGTSLSITLVLTFAMSMLNFNGISAFLLPILTICYPALIMLSLLNIFYKLFDFKPVKIPVLIVFTGSLILYFT